MAPKKVMAPIGRNPIDAKYHLSIQSKAVGKYTKFLLKVIFANLDFRLLINWEAVKLWN